MMTRVRAVSSVVRTISLLVLVPAAGFAQPSQTPRDPGLLVRLYEIGVDMRHLPALAPGQKPNIVRVVPVVDLRGERGDFEPLKDRFMTEVTGFISVTQQGKYTFRLISDDGARLWIDGKLLVDHDGLHGPEPKDGLAELSIGEHELRLLHFESGGGEQLTLEWRLAGAAAEKFELIPAAVLSHGADASRETSPGKKRVIPPLRRGRPGDGTPLAAIHPGFHRFIPDPDHRPLSLDLCLEDGRLRVIGSKARRWWRPYVEAWLPSDGGPSPFAHVYSLAGEPPIAPEDPYADQLLVYAEHRRDSQRVFLEDLDGLIQGCAFRFGVTTFGSVAPGAKPTFEMLAVRAMANGFEIEFTKPLDPRVGWDAECYYVEQWSFDNARGVGPTRDGVVYAVKSASVSADRRRVFIEMDDLKTSHLVYIRLLPPCISEDGELPWSTEAWYTLNAIPRDRTGKVLPPPAREPQNFLTEEERAGGWRLLFDGETANGWRGYKKDAFPHEGWKVIDGCLVRVGTGGDIVTEEQFDNFELKLEWRISPGGNSGIFFRVGEDENVVWRTGPEMQVLDNAEHADGRNPKTSAGSNYGLHAPPRDVTRPLGLFNEVRILANGNHIEYWLNGVKTVEYDVGSPQWEKLIAASKFAEMPRHGRTKKGHIALQDHGDKVWYRNIKIRPLP